MQPAAPDWERTASNQLKRYGYVVISCANFSSRADYSHRRRILPHFVHLRAVGHRQVASKRLELRMLGRGGGMRVLGTLDLDDDDEITQDHIKIIPRYSHDGYRLDILVVCGWWESARPLEDHEQRMESGGLLRYMFADRHLFISQYSLNPHTGNQQEVQLGVLAGGMLHDDYELGTMWMDHMDGLGEFSPEAFLLLRTHRDGCSGVLAVPVIARLEESERVMPPDVSRFEIISADGAAHVGVLPGDA
jgi:hypothetical protein